MLARIDAVDADIAAVDYQIGDHLAPFADAVVRLGEIPGIGPTAAAIIIAEIGLDMSRFPTPAHLSSWAKFAPGINSSAGKTKATARPVTGTATSPASWARPRSEHLARHDAVGGEPDCPVRLGSLDRGDKPTKQLFVVMRILTSGRDGLTWMPEMGLQ
jgi:Transposase IS116/IS110/IS902 family